MQQMKQMLESKKYNIKVLQESIKLMRQQGTSLQHIINLQQQKQGGGARLKIGNNKNSRKIKRRKHNTRKLKIGKKLKTTKKYRRKKNDTRRKKIKVNTI